MPSANHVPENQMCDMISRHMSYLVFCEFDSKNRMFGDILRRENR
jgi:hypothetical protein